MIAEVAGPLNGDKRPQGDADRRIVSRAKGSRKKIENRPLGLVLLRRDVSP